MNRAKKWVTLGGKTEAERQLNKEADDQTWSKERLWVPATYTNYT